MASPYLTFCKYVVICTLVTTNVLITKSENGSVSFSDTTIFPNANDPSSGQYWMHFI